MMISLTPKEIETLLTSLLYSKQRIEDSRDTPSAIKKESLFQIESVERKLRLELKG